MNVTPCYAVVAENDVNAQPLLWSRLGDAAVYAVSWREKCRRPSGKAPDGRMSAASASATAAAAGRRRTVASS